MYYWCFNSELQKNFASASTASRTVEGLVGAAAIELGNGIRINGVSPTVIEASSQYFPFFPGDIPVTMKEHEFGFRKSVFGASYKTVIIYFPRKVRLRLMGYVPDKYTS